MTSERLSSDKTIKIVSQGEEHIRHYVERHELNKYQLKKLIKAETSIKDRNSVLNFLKKEQDKLKSKEKVNEKELKHDKKDIGNLKDDLAELQEDMASISKVSNLMNPVKNKKAGEKGEEDAEKSRTVKKSARKMRDEVDEFFDSVPKNERKGLLSEIKKTISGKEDVSDLINDRDFVDIFNRLEDLKDREKCIKAAYATKNFLEIKKQKNLNYNELSILVKDLDIPQSDVASEFFNYMSIYDTKEEFNFEDADKVISICRSIFQTFD